MRSNSAGSASRFLPYLLRRTLIRFRSSAPAPGLWSRYSSSKATLLPPLEETLPRPGEPPRSYWSHVEGLRLRLLPDIEEGYAEAVGRTGLVDWGQLEGEGRIWLAGSMWCWGERVLVED